MSVYTTDELARIGAKHLYSQLQAQLRELVRVCPDVIDEPDTAAPPTEQPSTPLPLVLRDVLLAVIPHRRKVSPVEVRELVERAGMTFGKRDAAAAIARVLHQLVDEKLLAHAGHARGSRYWRKAD